MHHIIDLTTDNEIPNNKFIKKKKRLFAQMYMYQESVADSCINIQEFKEYMKQKFETDNEGSFLFSLDEIDSLITELSNDSKLIIDDEEGKYYLI